MLNDLLTDALRSTGFSARSLTLCQLQEDSALAFPCDRSVGFHVILQGPVYLFTDKTATPLCLNTGDIAVMARSTHHYFSLHDTLAKQAVIALNLQQPWQEQTDPVNSHLLGTAYQFWHTPVHPFFTDMPAWTVLHASDIPSASPINPTLALLKTELHKPASGALMIADNLLDVLFAYVMRHISAQQAKTHSGWSQGVHDPLIGRVMHLMQHELDANWTLEKLAQQSGVSRTALAERFREATGDTPLNHLRTLRMQQAMQLLSNTSATLDSIASSVGYQDAFGFSKAFKRITGLAPRAFRLQDQLDKDNPLRMQRHT